MVYPIMSIIQHRKEWSTDTGYSMNDPQILEKSHSPRPHVIWINLCEMSQLCKSIGKESRLEFERKREMTRGMSLTTNGCGVSFWGDKIKFWN